MATKLFRVTYERVVQLYVEADDAESAEEATSENIDEWMSDGGIPDVSEIVNATAVVHGEVIWEKWRGALPYRDNMMRGAPERTCEQLAATLDGDE